MSMARWYPEFPATKSIWLITNHTGAFMITFRATRRITNPQRIGRIHPRTGHRQTARIPATYANSGVLDADDTVIAVAAAMPASAKNLDFLSFQSQKKRGSKVAPNAPARMETANGPWARMAPSRNEGTIGIPPKNPNTF